MLGSRLGCALPLVLAASAALAGCGRSTPPPASPAALEVEVWSDTSRSVPFRVDPPRAVRVWVRSVSPNRPAAIEAPLPAADAGWAGGSEDPARVAAATACARAMRFYPALRAGRPVAVWCRQRFDFPGR